MKNEKVRNGVRTCKHFAKSIKISENGLLVEKEFIDHENGNRITRLDFFNHERRIVVQMGAKSLNYGYARTANNNELQTDKK